MMMICRVVKKDVTLLTLELLILTPVLKFRFLSSSNGLFGLTMLNPFCGPQSGTPGPWARQDGGGWGAELDLLTRLSKGTTSLQLYR